MRKALALWVKLFKKFMLNLLPIDTLQVGEFKETPLPIIYRKILKFLFRCGLTKIFALGLLYSVLPECKGGFVIDLGCGAGYTFGMLKALDYKGKFKESYVVGVDIFKPYLKRAKLVYHDVLLCDIRFLPIRKAELALIIGVLEHLNKEEGVLLLKELKSRCRHVVLTTTFGCHPHHPELDNNPYQKHRSAWFHVDLESLGFSVITFSFYKIVNVQQKLPPSLKTLQSPLFGSLR